MDEICTPGTLHSLLLALCCRNPVRRLDPLVTGPLTEGATTPRLLDLAANHRVLGLVLSVLPSALPPDLEPGVGVRVRELLRDVRRRAALFELRRDQVVADLQGAGLRPVVLKGAALGTRFYDEPAQRDLSDLDILVSREQLDRSLDVLRNQGYEGPKSAEDSRAYREHHFHIPLRHPGAHIAEIHWALTRANLPFQLDAEAFLSRVVPIERPDRPVLLMPAPELMLLHLVGQNLQEGFSRVARLVDLDRIIASGVEIDWDVFLAAARDGGLGPASALSLHLAERLLGADVPTGVLRQLEPSPAARFHLEIMHPVESTLTQHTTTTYAAKRLQELWLIGSAGKRFAYLLQTLMPEITVPPSRGGDPHLLERSTRLAKLVLLQLSYYMASAGSRGKSDFWRNGASN